MRAEIYKIFETHNIALKNLKEIDLREFSSKRTLECDLGIDVKGFYTIVFIRSAKSRFLRKEFEQISQICSQVEAKFDVKIKKRVIFYSSQICSKTENLIKESGWKYDAM